MTNHRGGVGSVLLLLGAGVLVLAMRRPQVELWVVATCGLLLVGLKLKWTQLQELYRQDW